MSKEELKHFLYVSIISADNYDYTEDQKQEVIARYHADEEDFDHKNWKFILAPIEDADKLVKLLSDDN